LCEGWDTGDLLAHLLVRERRPDAAAGVVVKPLAGWTARVSAGYAKRPWAEQVRTFRSGPPAFSPLGWGPIDAKVNGMELFIHHEDARRGQPDWQPRQLDQATRRQLIPTIRSSLLLRGLKRVGVPVTARLSDAPDGQDRTIVLVPAPDRGRTDTSDGVVLSGGLAEILLWLTGRSQFRLEFEGAAADVTAVRSGGGRPVGR
jgi:uncharacterized protein (TIGR03085 family)